MEYQQQLNSKQLEPNQAENNNNQDSIILLKYSVLFLILSWLSFFFPLIIMFRMWGTNDHPLYLKLGSSLAFIFPLISLVFVAIDRKKLNQETPIKRKNLNKLYLIISIILLIIGAFLGFIGLSV